MTHDDFDVSKLEAFMNELPIIGPPMKRLNNSQCQNHVLTYIKSNPNWNDNHQAYIEHMDKLYKDEVILSCNNLKTSDAKAAFKKLKQITCMS